MAWKIFWEIKFNTNKIDTHNEIQQEKNQSLLAFSRLRDYRIRDGFASVFFPAQNEARDMGWRYWFYGCYFGLLRHWMDHDKMFKELFLELNARFDKLNEDLNAIVKKEALKGGKSSNQVIQDYLNLCTEEFLWYKLGRIDEDVWISWKQGMDYYCQNSAEVETFFLKEKAFNQSYNRLFDELKIKETKEKIKDSN